MNRLKGLIYPGWLIILALSAGGCGLIPGQKDDSSFVDKTQALPKLADLEPLDLDDEEQEEVDISISEVIVNYGDLLPTIDDPEMKVQVLYRLADLKMLVADEGAELSEAAKKAAGVVGAQPPSKASIINPDTEGSSLTSSSSELEPQNLAIEADTEEGELAMLELTISTYQDLLSKYPNRPENDQVLYQLAKAYDLLGQQDKSLQTLNKLINDHPESPYRIEAQFRRGDIFYSRSNYKAANQAFSDVLNRSDTSSTFYEKAMYMKGWSEFKMSEFNLSLATFMSLLDIMIPQDKKEVTFKDENKKLIDDQFRVIGFALSYLEGGKTLQKLFEVNGSKNYEYLMYERYAELLLEQELYVDALNVYDQFTKLHPVSRWGPFVQKKVIDIHISQQQYTEARLGKERFIRAYGIRSNFWGLHGEDVQKFLAQQLEEYLEEIARFHHASAQTLAKSNKDPQQEYVLAAKYYLEFTDTFPKHVKAAEMTHLRGESLYEAGALFEAIKAYEKAAYEYPETKFTGLAEAGYAAISTYEEMIEKVAVEQRTELVRRQIASQVKFVETFPLDSRALTIQSKTADTLFYLKDFEAAIIQSEKLTQWQPAPDQVMLLNGWMIWSHSHYEMSKYSRAEQGYMKALSLMPNQDPRRKDTENLLAATIYKQAEKLEAQDKVDLAIDEYLRVALVVPTTELATSAQYDAFTKMLAIGQFERAIPIMDEFRRKHPDHELTKDVTAKLAFAYQNTEQWQLAADELMIISNQHQSIDVKRDSLLQAAELYEKNEAWPKAIKAYRQYAHGYPSPLEPAIEASHKLTELYGKTGEQGKRLFWMNHIVKAYRKQSGATSDRVKFIVANASNALADKAYFEFDQVKLVNPLNVNLAKKKKTMSQALKAYKQAQEFNIAEVTTRATFQMGEIYRKFSIALMESERPSGLTELELEEYDLLLEEQAFPFEEDAIGIYESNALRSRQGVYDIWVKNSFKALESLFPARYSRSEEVPVVSDSIL